MLPSRKQQHPSSNIGPRRPCTAIHCQLFVSSRLVSSNPKTQTETSAASYHNIHLDRDNCFHA
ncbi:hypothetical protein DL98DRAFT_518411 [Cadophora sp. DSE1049]|nr:hypothetical protein DL98DRAFT_518411 [Cadophora sp. DSE1049]